MIVYSTGKPNLAAQIPTKQGAKGAKAKRKEIRWNNCYRMRRYHIHMSSRVIMHRLFNWLVI